MAEDTSEAKLPISTRFHLSTNSTSHTQVYRNAFKRFFTLWSYYDFSFQLLCLLGCPHKQQWKMISAVFSTLNASRSKKPETSKFTKWELARWKRRLRTGFEIIYTKFRVLKYEYSFIQISNIRLNFNTYEIYHNSVLLTGSNMLTLLLFDNRLPT